MVNIDMRYVLSVHIYLLNSVGSWKSGKMATDLKAEHVKENFHFLILIKVWEVIGFAVECSRCQRKHKINGSLYYRIEAESYARPTC
jgi:hypothetical protein